MVRKALWHCPRCGRKFTKKSQWHSCLARSVASHFEGKPTKLKALFDSLTREMRRFGPIRIDAVQTSINFAGKYHFAGLRVQKDSLRLGFLLDRRLDDERILRTQKLGEAAFGHSVKLARREDIDARLLGWLKAAYRLRR